jgi:membrane protein implicated in regulation of membrane protease activity
MDGHWVWWIAAAILVGAELVTGTFYLLAIGVAAAAGGTTAWLGGGLPLQFLVGGGLAVALTIAAREWRRRQQTPPAAVRDSLDVGQTVHVQTWNPDGTARVAYRGSLWDAELAAADTPHAETLYIVGTRGSVLVLSDRRPAP